MSFKFTDLKNDILVEDKVIKLYIDGYDSIHQVRTYEVKSGAYEGKKYFVFDCIDGKSVMNYVPKNYELLYSQIKIDIDEPIYQMYSKLDSYDLVKIPLSYRRR